MGSVTVALRRPQATALWLSGSATAIAAVVGVFCVRNASLAHEWRICGFPGGCNYQGNAAVSPLPTTSVSLPNGAVMSIGLYAGLIVGCGALLALAMLAYAERLERGPRLVLWAMAALLVLSLVCFRLPPPTRLVGLMGPCISTNSCPTEVDPYPAAISSVCYVVPAAALGLLTALLSLIPSQPPVLAARPPNQT
jgi:hypothetical protein